MTLPLMLATWSRIIAFGFVMNADAAMDTAVLTLPSRRAPA